jgi:hypothetical protein
MDGGTGDLKMDREEKLGLLVLIVFFNLILVAGFFVYGIVKLATWAFF